MEDYDMRVRASSDVNKELLEIKTSLASLEGSINTLHSEMRSGDKLLTTIVENQLTAMNEYRKELKEATKEFRDSIFTLTQSAASQASAVRVDVEAQLVEHEQSNAPHETTLGTRVSKLEHDAIRLRVYGGLVTFVGWGGIAAIFKFLGHS